METLNGASTLWILNDLYKSKHLYQILVTDLDRGFTSGTLYSMSRQVFKQKFDGYITVHAISLIDLYTFQHLAHPAFTQRRQGGVNLIVYVSLFLFFSLYIY